MLFLLGGVIVSTTLHSLPTVGTIQGLAPALRGEADPAVSPGAAEVRFIDHHAFGLIAGNLLQAVAIAFLILVLLFLLGAVRFRRPETSRVARGRWFSVGGVGMVLVSIAHPLAQVLNAHSFVTGHDFTAEAVNHALTQSSVLEVSEYIGLLAGLALAAGMVVVTLGATRTGLMARWTMYLGIFAALLAFTPFGLALGEVQQLIPAFWMVTLGILLMGRWPGGDPAAWAAGEARPWPSSAEPAPSAMRGGVAVGGGCRAGGRHAAEHRRGRQRTAAMWRPSRCGPRAAGARGGAANGARADSCLHFGPPPLYFVKGRGTDRTTIFGPHHFLVR